MYKHLEPEMSKADSVSALAHAVGNFAQTDGDYATAIPVLTLHRRSAPTKPLHCIYSLGLGVTAQGGKHVMLRKEVIDYGPGQSMLTTIDLPVVSHVTQASVRKPFLGLLLTLDARHILNQSLDAGNAGGLVGYESASQFSREYSRLFGAPPQRDIKRMRQSQTSSRQ
jgi:hypothetical protein